MGWLFCIGIVFMTVGQSIGQVCNSAEQEINFAFSDCYYNLDAERCCSREIARRLSYCYPYRSWKAVVWRPILSSYDAHHVCSQSSTCGCYSGTNSGQYSNYEYSVASTSTCPSISSIDYTPSPGEDARTTVQRILNEYAIKWIQLCSAGAVRYRNVPQGPAVALAYNDDTCFKWKQTTDSALWAFN